MRDVPKQLTDLNLSFSSQSTMHQLLYLILFSATFSTRNSRYLALAIDRYMSAVPISTHAHVWALQSLAPLQLWGMQDDMLAVDAVDNKTDCVNYIPDTIKVAAGSGCSCKKTRSLPKWSYMQSCIILCHNQSSMRA